MKIKLREIRSSPEYPESLPNFEPPSDSFFYRPYLGDNQTLMILDLLERLKPKKCFEWGAGWSTVFFPRLFPEAKWISVEHKPFWIKVLDPHLLPNSIIILREKLEDYVNEPLKWIQDRPFDFVFVNGEKRKECVKVSSTILREGGIVLKHDTNADEPIIVNGEDVRDQFDEHGLIQGLWWARK